MVAAMLYVADTESHVIRSINVKTGIITTVLGTGTRGDGPETDPLQMRARAAARNLRGQRPAFYTWATVKRIAFAC